MNFLQQLQEQYNVDLMIVAIVLLSGFFQNRYLCKWIISRDEKFDGAIKTLMVSAIASIVWILLSPERAREDIRQYFFSYFLATSLYELLLRPFVKWIKQITNQQVEG